VRRCIFTNERAREEDRDDDAQWPWELNEIGECLLEPDSKILPLEEKVLRRIRKFKREGKALERERELRQRAVRDGTLVDLTERMTRDAMERMWERSGTETSDEP
jgi:hypothetical protein